MGSLAPTPGPGVPAGSSAMGLPSVRGGERSGHLGGDHTPAGTSSMPSHEMSPVMHEQSAINTNAGTVLGPWNPGAEAEPGPSWCWGAGIAVHLLESAGAFPVHHCWLPRGQKTFV